MRFAAVPIIASALLAAPAAQAQRAVVDASAPSAISVTVYRDPDRGVGQDMRRDWPQGFAMISETREVTLPPGESTIRFEGVAEGMVAVSAIVTGLPGGTIEKNRNAELLSPAALVNGTLGNRVTITRTNPATGQTASQDAIVRTRADGGLVLQTSEGFEAVRCSGLPEKLTFDRVPHGLSAQPVFTIDTREPDGGTYRVTLTYLAWGFDWQANYVATLGEGDGKGGLELKLSSWLTLLNDNAQSFPDADLLAVAGTLNVTSDFRDLSDPPRAEPLRLVCYPLGSTAAGTSVPYPPPPPPAPPPPPMAEAQAIVVTGSRRKAQLYDSPAAMVAAEEALGDLKLYRVPEPVTVAAKGMKQIAFLEEDSVKARLLYRAECSAFDEEDGEAADPAPTRVILATKNVEEKGLGAALPMGGLILYEPTSDGLQLAAELDMRDYPVGQDVELELGNSAQVFAACTREDDFSERAGRKWIRMRANVSNANSSPVTVRLVFGPSGEWDVRLPRAKTRVKDGLMIAEISVPAHSRRELRWKRRHANDAAQD